MEGSYVLVIKNSKSQNIQIGKLSEIFFKKGFYAYVGSALNGVEERVERHLKSSDEKKLHWHIDYLLDETEIVEVFCKESEYKEECKIANCFKERLKPISGFGCSDCSCDSHLFYGSYEDMVSCSKSSNLAIYTK
ncbi:MAG: GIY-YIG nuclease family protein [Candidatus Thermoplasmatota archaeon]